VVMRQQDAREPAIDVRTMLARPRQLGSRVARQDGIARQRDALPVTARRGQRDETVLLAGNPDRHDACTQGGIEIRETLPDRLKPPLGMLLATAVGPFDQCQRPAANRKHAATIGVVDKQLDALGADVEADDDAHAAARPRPSAASLLAGAAFFIEAFKTPTLFRNPDPDRSRSCRQSLVARSVTARRAATSAAIALRLDCDAAFDVAAPQLRNPSSRRSFSVPHCRMYAVDPAGIVDPIR